jgi:phosphoribosylformimino-5-aminoimidazole carboxamide ribotide isomerase
MIIIPAIDLKGGKVVRLEQGLMDRDKEYSDDPASMAKKWQDLGAELIHVVDLDGAFAGKPENKDAVISIANAVDVPIELGGGVRDLDTIREYLDKGVGRIILGTVAHKNQKLAKEACRKFPGKIVIGIDAKDGFVSIQGWADVTDMPAIELAKKYEGLNVAAIIYTDIARDGMMTGPSTDSTLDLAKAVDIPVIASGGIKNLDHIKELLPYEKDGITGVITGKAIYEGTLDLVEAIKIANGG